METFGPQMQTFGCVKAFRAPGPPPDLSFNGFGMLSGHVFGVFSWFWDAFGTSFFLFVHGCGMDFVLSLRVLLS